MPHLFILLRSHPYMATALMVAFAKTLTHPFYGGSYVVTYRLGQVKAYVPGKERMS